MIRVVGERKKGGKGYEDKFLRVFIYIYHVRGMYVFDRETGLERIGKILSFETDEMWYLLG